MNSQLTINIQNMNLDWNQRHTEASFHQLVSRCVWFFFSRFRFRCIKCVYHVCTTFTFERSRCRRMWNAKKKTLTQNEWVINIYQTKSIKTKRKPLRNNGKEWQKKDNWKIESANSIFFVCVCVSSRDLFTTRILSCRFNNGKQLKMKKNYFQLIDFQSFRVFFFPEILRNYC